MGLEPLLGFLTWDNARHKSAFSGISSMEQRVDSPAPDVMGLRSNPIAAGSVASLPMSRSSRLISLRKTLRSGSVSYEGPSDEGVGVPVNHLVLGLEAADDRHVLLESTFADDLLPLGD